MIGGFGRISWELDPHFVDPFIFSFQLQFSQSGGSSTADDWVNIGTPQVNVTSLIDPTQRLHGKTQTLAYRVVLTTNVTTYYSDPAEVLGKFNFHDWIIVHEITRKELLRHKVFASVNGYLLKARRYGIACPCSDTITGELQDSYCPNCYGTTFVGGYFDPIPAYFVDISQEQSREHRDLQAVGTDKKVVTHGRMLGVPMLVQGDAWINGGSDERYYLHTVTEKATWKSVPVIYEVEMRLAAFSDALYQVPIPPK